MKGLYNGGDDLPKRSQLLGRRRDTVLSSLHWLIAGSEYETPLDSVAVEPYVSEAQALSTYPSPSNASF